MHHPGAVLRAGGHTTYFCSEHCRDRYSGPDSARAADVSAERACDQAAARAQGGPEADAKLHEAAQAIARLVRS